MNLQYEANYTLRLIRRRYGFSALCITVIAIGYLITLPLYSFVKNFAYTTLPYPDGDRLVAVKPYDEFNQTEMASANFDAFQFNSYNSSLGSLEQLGAYHSEIVALSDGDFGEQFFGFRTTANALEFTAIPPSMGRPLLRTDEIEGAEPVVLISNRVWRNYYAADPDVIGRTSIVNGQPHTVVGVMPPDFRYPMDSDLWLPLTIPAAAVPGDGAAMTLIGILNEGANRTQASEEARAISEQLATDYPDQYENRSAFVIRFTQNVINNGMFIFDAMGTVGTALFLLICLNISNLLMIRANERVTELAIRSAVGARKVNLFLHVLLESLMICAAGTVIGIALATFVLSGMETLFSTLMGGLGLSPFWMDFSFGSDELATSILMLLVLWLLSGFFAAWRGTQGDITSILGSDSKTLAIEKGGKITRFIVHLQMTLSFFLLILSGVFVLSFQSSLPQSPVNRSDDFIIGNISVEAVNFANPEHSKPFRDAFKSALVSNPGFTAATFSTSPPGDATSGIRALMAGDTTDADNAVLFGINWIDEDLFSTIDFPILEGRNFTTDDTLESPLVAIVDETFVTRMQLEGSPVGQAIQLYDFDGNATEQVTIIGVVPQSNMPDSEVTARFGPRIYIPLSQNPTLSGFQFTVRMHPSTLLRPIAEVERELREISSGVNRDITLYRIMLLSNPIELNASGITAILGMFAAAAVGALVLSVISIYGLISRSVLARTGEMGIRRAMGASDLRIVKIFLYQGLLYLSVAFVFGGGLGAIAMSAAQSSLTSISGFNAMIIFSSIFTTVTVVVGVLVLVASYVPTRRLVTMEPGEALHYE